MRYSLGGPPTVIVTIGDNRDYTRVLLYFYYTTITGWGVFLRYSLDSSKRACVGDCITRGVFRDY